MGYRIENRDRPGYFWSSKFRKFCSEFGDDFKVYQERPRAIRAAARLAKVYGVAVVEYGTSLHHAQTPRSAM